MEKTQRRFEETGKKVTSDSKDHINEIQKIAESQKNSPSVPASSTRFSHIKGAKPDKYDLEVEAQLKTSSITQSLPTTAVFTGEKPVSLQNIPRPELVYGKSQLKNPEKELSESSNQPHVVKKKRRRIKSRTTVFDFGLDDETDVEHPELPEKPFLTDLLLPFTNVEFQRTFIAMLAIGTLPTVAFIYAGPKGFQLFASGIDGAGGDVAVSFLALITFGVVACSFWLSLMSTYLLDFFVATSDGDDLLEHRPEFSYVDGIFLTGQLVFITLWSLVPGYLFWFFLNLFYLDMHGAAVSWTSLFNPLTIPLHNEHGEVISMRFSFVLITACIISQWIFFPMIFLFSNETSDSKKLSFQLIHSFSLVPKKWIEFYYLTFPIAAFFACFVYSYFINGIFLETHFDNAVLYATFLLLGSFTFFLYFRLLGRLAWVIVDAIRREA